MADTLVPIYGTAHIPAIARDYDYKTKIHYFARVKGRFIVLSVRDRLKKEVTQQVEFSTFYKDTYFKRHTTLSANSANPLASGNLTVVDSSPFVKGTLVWNANKNEQALVSANPPDATTLPVTASSAINDGDALSQWASGDTIMSLGNSLGETQSGTSQISTAVSQVKNRTRYYHRQFGLSERGQSERPRSGQALAEKRFEAEQRFADDLDWGALFGRNFEILEAATDQNRTGSRGIVQQIKVGADGVIAPAANYNLTITALSTTKIIENIIRPATRYAGDGAMMLCGAQLLMDIDKTILGAASSRLQLLPRTTNDWGLRVQKLVSTIGELELMHYAPFDEFVSGFYGSYGLSIDKNDIWIRHFPGYAEPKFQDIPRTSNRLDEWEYVTDEGYEIRTPRNHCFFKATA